MRDPIKELIIETLGKEGVVDSRAFGHWALSDEQLEKFAQLIALECAQLAMTQHISTSPADYGEMDPYDQGCDDTASTISGLIRRTFGVEE